MSIRLFLSYSRRDEALKDELAKHLNVMVRQKLIEPWHDRQIIPGSDWAKEIDTYLNSAQIILLLVSPDFLDSDYCYGVELARSIERDQAGEARVIPIILRPCDWQESPLVQLQALPRDAKPITRWDDRDEAFLDAAKGIRRAIEQLNHSQPRPPVTPAPPPPRTPASTVQRVRPVNHRAEPLIPEGTRRRFIQLAGLGGVGAAAFALYEGLKPQPPSVDSGKIGLLLRSYEFDVVTVNEWGEEISRPGQARFFVENLGNGISLEMTLISEGSFLRGSPTEPPEKDRNDDEGPQRQVKVPAFYMGKFPITQAQYQAIMGKNPSAFTENGANRPVESVSWHDAAEFIAKLIQKTGRPYRLPSEAEWEYACRAGTTTPFYFGETLTTRLANYDGRAPYRSEPKGESRGQTTAVGSFWPNGFGLYDMHGNVWEWCEDVYHQNYDGAPIDGSAWVTEGSDSQLLRGGGWGNSAGGCRSADRNNVPPHYRVNDLGFRVVCGSA